MKDRLKKILYRHRMLLVGIVCLSCLCVLSAQDKPKQLKPVPKAKLTVPASPKQHEGKTRIDLLHADEAKADQGLQPDAEILVGNVKLRHDSMYMYCDSAQVYEKINSVEAFGNIRMEQGDTLFIYGDYLYYDGMTQMAMLRENVRLIDRKTELKTDSLNYDRVLGLGYYFDGGVMTDEDNVLTSEWGEYSPSTKQAVFNHDVKLVNPKFTLSSDTLRYNTGSNLANIVGPSVIDSEDGHIYSERGDFNTSTQIGHLMDRSIMVNGPKRLVADSIFYDRHEGYGEAFHDIIMTDTLNQNLMTGNYCYYSDSTGYAMATDKALAVDYSQGDSLFVHGDTLKMYTYNMKTDSVCRELRGYHHVRAYRSDIQAVSDSIVYISKDSCMTMYGNPVLWNGGNQLLGEEIKVFLNDSTIERGQIVGQALAIERHDSIHYNQVAGREMTAFFRAGEIYQVNVNGNVLAVYYPIDDKDSTIIGMDYSEGSFLRMMIKERKMEQGAFIGQSNGVLYPLDQVPAERRKLPTFVWLDYMRPLNKDDIFEWRGKREDAILHKSERKPIASPRNLHIERTSKK